MSNNWCIFFCPWYSMPTTSLSARSSDLILSKLLSWIGVYTSQASKLALLERVRNSFGVSYGNGYTSIDHSIGIPSVDEQTTLHGNKQTNRGPGQENHPDIKGNTTNVQKPCLNLHGMLMQVHSNSLQCLLASATPQLEYFWLDMIPISRMLKIL